MKKISIYIATSKNKWFPTNESYKPIHVGDSEMHGFYDKRMCFDNTGDNISKKNPVYCELTALYWIWKNDIDSDYIGLSHYRRYFKFNNNVLERAFFRLLQFVHPQPILVFKSTSDFFKDDLNPKGILDVFDEQYDIILPKPARWNIFHRLIYRKCRSMKEIFVDKHPEIAWNIFQDVIVDLYPEYQDAMRLFLDGHKNYYFNMFIMRKDDFDDYMGWMFSILFEAEKRLNGKLSDEEWSRQIGFLAEYLIGIYVQYHNMKVKDYPVVWINDTKRFSYTVVRSVYEILHKL
ncbi:MAG: DUF4422 domain-containing protein [Selenomonas sp.]|jgi:hypothetical protein|nr:DUF4422 domain-containing protein [Selenomonas sp.]